MHFIVFITICFLAAIPAPLFGADPFQFLTSQWNVLYNTEDNGDYVAGTPKYAAYLPGEIYNIGFSNVWPGGEWAYLRIRSAEQTYKTVASSIVGAAAGISPMASYPVLAQRGQNGVPTVEELKSFRPSLFKPGANINIVGSDGRPFPAVIMTKIERKKPPQAEHVTAEMLAQYTAVIALGYLFSMDPRERREERLKWFAGNKLAKFALGAKDCLPSGQFFFLFVPSNEFLEMFQDLEMTPFHYFAPYLPQNALQQLSSTNFDRFLTHLDDYLGSLEQIPHRALFGVVDPYLRELDHMTGIPLASLRRRFEANRTNVRKHLVTWLSNQHLPSARLQDRNPRLKAPLWNVTNLLGLSSPIDSAQNRWTAFANRSSAVDLSTSTNAQSRAPAAVVTPRFSRTEHPLPKRPASLTQQRKTLVIVSANDHESRRIISIAKELGHDVFEVMNKNKSPLAHGEPLSERAEAAIMKIVTEGRYRDVILIELPNQKLEQQLTALKRRLNVIIMDHHRSSRTNRDGELLVYHREHPLTPLQQFARFFQYELSDQDTIMAYRDQGGPHGLLLNLGLPLEEAIPNAFRDPAMRIEWEAWSEEFAKLLPIQTRLGELFVLDNFPNSFLDICSYFAFRDHLRTQASSTPVVMSSVIIKKKRLLSFVGSQTIGKRIVAAIDNQYPNNEMVVGGNLSTVMYFHVGMPESWETKFGPDLEAVIEEIKVGSRAARRKAKRVTETTPPPTLSDPMDIETYFGLLGTLEQSGHQSGYAVEDTAAQLFDYPTTNSKEELFATVERELASARPRFGLLSTTITALGSHVDSSDMNRLLALQTAISNASLSPSSQRTKLKTRVHALTGLATRHNGTPLPNFDFETPVNAINRCAVVIAARGAASPRTN